MDALIRYFLHKECTTIDDFAKYWNEVVYLSQIGVLNMAQLPLKLE